MERKLTKAEALLLAEEYQRKTTRLMVINRRAFRLALNRSRLALSHNGTERK